MHTLCLYFNAKTLNTYTQFNLRLNHSADQNTFFPLINTEIRTLVKALLHRRPTTDGDDCRPIYRTHNYRM